MTRVAILPVPDEQGKVSYHAVAGERRSEGGTAGEALDALSKQIPEDESTWVIVQQRRPDAFFTAEQQQRLSTLMERWRSARDQGTTLEPEEQAELEQLVEAELVGATKRAAAMADALHEPLLFRRCRTGIPPVRVLSCSGSGVQFHLRGGARSADGPRRRFGRRQPGVGVSRL